MITKITERQGSLIAEFIDLKRFTLANVEKVKTELTPILAQKHTHLIFDFQKIEFIDSSAIGCIISLVKTAQKHGGTVKLANITPNVMDVLELLRLPMILDIIPTIEDGL